MAQKIYKKAFKHVKTNRLNEETRLFAKQGDRKGYFPKDKVYYAGLSKLPKEYIKDKDLAIFDYPKERNVEGDERF
ncbi:MAG: hypothetical protein H0A76_08415 [Candidatus Thiodubiliella endoseptemdiera]|uniref:Uncharacterized protein n=1 Tax=Candidatus Thiodubiliella endoseptemdiera TaxID=2738886 RepID=A0A853F1R7_9GAMM|nr:hypothetical protein [Candidatus Thiodubiliella endoseptemdiera]